MGTRELGFEMGQFPSTSVQEAPEMLGAVRHGELGKERTCLSGATQDVSPWGHQVLLAQLALPKSP